MEWKSPNLYGWSSVKKFVIFLLLVYNTQFVSTVPALNSEKTVILTLFNFPLIFQKGRHVCYVSFYYHNLIITELKLSCLISWFLFLIWNSSSTRIGHLNQELCHYSYSILNRLGGIFLQYMNILTRANFAGNCCNGDLLYSRNILLLLLLSLFWQKILFRWL